jgi:hypothetical protein
MAERRKVWKWFWVWDFEKEERWLNRMAMDGWVLTEVGFANYTFERCEPGEYIIRLQMHKPDEEYLSFLEEIGAEYIGRMVQWIYFRRKSEEGPFELFSDAPSKIEHLNWIARTLLPLGIANLLIGIVNSLNGSPIGAVNVILATLLMYGLGRIHGKIESLEKDRELQE